MRFEHWYYTVPLRLRSLFQRRRVERELEEEMEYYVERRIQEEIARGLTPEEARHLALRGLEQRKEECRDMRRVGFVENLVQDLRYAGRMLHKTPAFTAIAAMSLALGIGASTAMFSITDALMLRKLPVRNPEQLVTLNLPGDQGMEPFFPYPEFQTMRALTQFFSDVTAVCPLDRSNVT